MNYLAGSTFALALLLFPLAPSAHAGAPTDMGVAVPSPPRRPPQPLRDRTKKQVRDGDDQRSGDDSKVKRTEKTEKSPPLEKGSK